MGKERSIRIISGGQTGADRTALAWAIRRGFPHGGWCPQGRRAEDGRIPIRYRLKSTPSANYVQRTQWNIRDSDATVILSLGPRLKGSTQKIIEFCRMWKKPCLYLCRSRMPIAEAAQQLREFLRANRIKILNVAGPRVSQEPDIGSFLRYVFDKSFGFSKKVKSKKGEWRRRTLR